MATQRVPSDLFVNFGTPAAAQTLHRIVVKYVLHVGPLRTGKASHPDRSWVLAG